MISILEYLSILVILVVLGGTLDYSIELLILKEVLNFFFCFSVWYFNL